MHRLSLVAASRAYSSLQCTGFSLWWLLFLQSSGSRRMGSVVMACRLQSAGSIVVAHGLSCSMACGVFPNQCLNQCPLHWQADSQPLLHQGSPFYLFYIIFHGLSQDIEYSSLCYILGPCCLSILNVIVHIYQPQTPSPSISVPTPLPLGNHKSDLCL